MIFFAVLHCFTQGGEGIVFSFSPKTSFFVSLGEQNEFYVKERLSYQIG